MSIDTQVQTAASRAGKRGLARRSYAAIAVLGLTLSGFTGAMSAAAAPEGYVVPKSGNFTTECAVDWFVASTMDKTLIDYPNNGFEYKIRPATVRGQATGQAEPGWSEMQHWFGSERSANWRLPVATEKTMLNAKLTVAVPVGADYRFTSDDSLSFFNNPSRGWPYAGAYRELNASSPQLASTTTQTFEGAEYVVYTFNLGTFTGGSAYALQLTGTYPQKVDDQRLHAFAKVTGTYLQGDASGCVPTAPQVPSTNPVGPCITALTGRTLRSLTSNDIAARDKNGKGGEVNADGWSNYFRLYGAVDHELRNVTYTATAAQGFRFASVDGRDASSFLTPSRFMKQWGSAAIELDESAKPVLSADGRTITLTIKRMPAGSSFSFNAQFEADGSGKQLVLDTALTGSQVACSVIPPVNPGTPSTPEPTKPAKPVEPTKPVKPVKPVKPSKPAVAMVTRTFQVDRYAPATASQARAVARFDDDRILKYREDRPLWGRSRWQIVTVRVPAKATHAQVMKAINAKTSARIGDVNTSRTLATTKAGRINIVAWELGRGATAARPWGPKNTVAQKFFARG